MFCDACGAAVQPGQAFCSRCGKQVVGPVTAMQLRPGRVQGHLHLLGHTLASPTFAVADVFRLFCSDFCC
jgi:predicted amidophosphoribosyltransferase